MFENIVYFKDIEALSLSLQYNLGSVFFNSQGFNVQGF